MTTRRGAPEQKPKAKIEDGGTERWETPGLLVPLSQPTWDFLLCDIINLLLNNKDTFFSPAYTLTDKSHILFTKDIHTHVLI